MAYVERTDEEIRAAWLRCYQRQLKDSKEPDKPVVGCMCHLLSLRQMVDCLERFGRGEKIDENLFGHGTKMYTTDVDPIREVARRSNKDPVEIINEIRFRPTPWWKTWSRFLQPSRSKN